MRYFPLLIVVLVIFAGLFSVVLLFWPSLLPTHLQQVSDRIALAQFSIEFASLAALLLAAWEFMQSRLKPALRVWIQPMKEAKDTGPPSKSTSETWVKSGFRSGEGSVYGFRFRVLLENVGKVSAKYVKVSLKVYETSLVEKPIHLERLRGTYPVGNWSPADPETRSNLQVFQGGDKLICYTHPRNADDLRPWMDELGQFELEVPVLKGKEESAFVKMRCTTQADNMDMFVEDLLFKFA